ncbi:MAG: hypothetical protein KDA28_16055, partial [Phycisphaerales bacterium]|nr:hypothetical protein [Phycisphaerales bacterium]
PCILIEPATIDFRTRRIGERYTEHVNISSCSASGGDELVVYEVALDGGSDAQFDVDPLPVPFTLSPGLFVGVDVGFVPDTDASFSGDLRISSNDPGYPTVRVPLTGSGTSTECPEAVARCRIVGTDEYSAGHLDASSLATIECDGSESTSLGASTRYEWSVVERPVGSTSTWTPEASVVAPSLFLDTAGRYVVRLVVYDDDVPSCEPSDVVIDADPDRDIFIQLTWRTPNDPDETNTGLAQGSDVDLHFLHPNGVWEDRTWDCHFRARAPNWGDPGRGDDDPSLEIDDTDGAGPEVITLNNPEPVTYRVGVHYWDDHGYGASFVTLRIFVEGDLVFEIRDREMPETDYFLDAAVILWADRDVMRIDRLYPDIP